MKKNKPLRIIILIFILELIVIGVLGGLFQRKINVLEEQINSGEITQLNQVKENCEELKASINKSLIIGMSIYGLITIILAVYLSKMVIYPLKKMIESKEKKEKAE